MTFINGKAYEFADVRLVLFGRLVTGITAISYEDSKDVQVHHGNNGQAVSYTKGNKTCVGSITLEMIEVEAIQAASPDGDITNIPPFNVAVSYVPDGGTMVTHTLEGALFTKNSRDTSSGGGRIEVELPLMLANIKWK